MRLMLYTPRNAKAQVWPEKTMPGQADGRMFVWAAVWDNTAWGWAGWYPRDCFTELPA